MQVRAGEKNARSQGIGALHKAKRLAAASRFSLCVPLSLIRNCLYPPSLSLSALADKLKSCSQQQHQQ